PVSAILRYYSVCCPSPAPTHPAISTLSLHDALPIFELRCERITENGALFVGRSGTRLTIYSIENIFKKHVRLAEIKRHITPHSLDRKSTRLNSSHVAISYAVFCLKKKNKKHTSAVTI